MSDTDRTLRAVAVELASSAPLPPPMPDLGPSSQSRWRGPRIAAAVALVTVVVPIVITAILLSVNSAPTANPDAASAAMFEATGAASVAIVADDGTVLRGYLWSGGDHAVILTQGFGSDASEIVELATAAHREGATVLLYENRGQGLSGGTADPDMLGSDLAAAIADLVTRGVESVSVASFSHAATAAIIVAADPPDQLEEVVAIFPFAQYQGLDAGAVVGDVAVPLHLVGSAFPAPYGPWVVSLVDASVQPDTTVEILQYPGDQISLLDANKERLIEIISNLAR